MTMTDPERLQNLMGDFRETALWRALQSLKSCVSFMNTGAHPDDETTSMLAALSLRDGIKISQACANRGEGGQNTIGAQNGAALGAIRTREMERAAKVINMTHYWLSQSPDDKIFDFGFSKSGDETLNKWGEARVLARFVEIIRLERPDIVCPTYLDISGQHGHHQAMTRAAMKAVRLAADPGFAPEQGLPLWQVKKLYLPAWSGAGDAYDDDVPPPPETVFVDASGPDKVLGADYTQIAQYSRSFHQTQGMGVWVEPGGSSRWPLNLAWHFSGVSGAEYTIFDGLPKTLKELAKYAKAPVLSELLAQAQNAMDSAIDTWPDTQKISGFAAQALSLLNAALAACPEPAKPEIVHRLEAKVRQLSMVLLLTRAHMPRACLSCDNVRPLDTFSLNIHALDEDISAVPVLPLGWTAKSVSKNRFEITLPETTPPSDPYPDIYRPETANDPLHIRLSWQEQGTPVKISIDPEERLTVQPLVSAKLSPEAAVLNLQNPMTVSLQVSEHHPVDATPALNALGGWQVLREGNKFTLLADADIALGLHEFDLSLDGVAAQTCKTTSFAHTGPTQLCAPAVLKVQVVDIVLPRGRIAYIGGGNDTADDMLRRFGVKLSSLEPRDVGKVDFSNFDTVLIGVFAFRTCASLAGRMSDLHAWVRNGGNLVTLYHRPWDNWDSKNTPLAPLTIGKPSLRWRITDENAAVTHLLPDHVLLNTLNEITANDWAGWDKERGLYFASQWDEKYAAPLEMADPNETAQQGALLSGVFGKGRHTHTSLILHHQLQKLVPGAAKLMMNILDNDR